MMNDLHTNLFDIYPHKAQYKPNEEIILLVEIVEKEIVPCSLRISIKEGHREIRLLTVNILEFNNSPIQIKFSIDTEQTWACYGVDAVLLDSSGREIDRRSTAFDIADHWRRAPRYGFLSDFAPEELGKLKDVDFLNKFHLNIVQFYDWMFRHDQLVPVEDTFIDPMGRELSFQVVKEKIEALNEKGIASIAYGAVYASLKDFHERHKEWGLYKRNGKPFELIKKFYIMDISDDSKWSEHIIKEFEKVIEAGFDGIHLDQYGFPKWALRENNGEKEMVSLAENYPRLINRVKDALVPINPEVGLIFNNVSNYPVFSTALAKQEAIYIEVWKPIQSFYELKNLILRARELGGEKSVILAAYLPAFNKNSEVPAEEAENGALLTMATIFSNGAYHLLLGEDEKILTVAYYPDYGVLRERFIKEIRNYFDFIVRYGQFLYPKEIQDVSYELFGGDNEDIVFIGDVSFLPNEQPGTVWVQVKQKERNLYIHLINLVGLEDDYWFTGKKNRPHEQNHILCRVKVLPDVKGVYWLTPDRDTIESISLPFEWLEEEGETILQFSIPSLKIWSMIHIEF